MKRKLETFLKSHGAYSKFIKNMRADCTKWGVPFELGLSNCTAIIAQFSWNKSPEGFDYWNKLHKAFCEIK